MEGTRDAILAAATRCFRRNGIRATTVVQIAREANVTRQTLYNHVPGGKDGLIAEVIVDEAHRVNERARRRLQPDMPAGELIPDAVVELALSARRSPYVEFLISGGALDVTSAVIDRSPGVAGVMVEFWMPILERLSDAGELRPGLDLDEAVRWLTFVHVGLVAQPGAFQSNRRLTRESVRRFVVPALVEPGG
jgi:AcrR family transcriptional regulator